MSLQKTVAFNFERNHRARRHRADKALVVSRTNFRQYTENVSRNGVALRTDPFRT